MRIAKETNDYILAFCPFHNDRKHPNLRVSKTGKYAGLYKCFACGAFGPAKELDVSMPYLKRLKYMIMPSDGRRPVLNSANWSKHLSILRNVAEQTHSADILAYEWNVKPETLELLQVGWNGTEYLFPCYLKGRICGFQRRGQDYKAMVRGSKAGLFVPEHLNDFVNAGRARVGSLIVTEGVSDLAVVLDLGYMGLGRFNAGQSAEPILWYLQRLQPSLLIVCYDNDKAGRDGALMFLAEIIKHFWGEVRTFKMPATYKDIRDWYAKDKKAFVKALKGQIEEAQASKVV